MNDVKCKGEHCHKRETCERYKAPASPNQSFFLFSPIRAGECVWYVETVADHIEPIEAQLETPAPELEPMQPKPTEKPKRRRK